MKKQPLLLASIAAALSGGLTPPMEDIPIRNPHSGLDSIPQNAPKRRRGTRTWNQRKRRKAIRNNPSLLRGKYKKHNKC